MNSQEKEAPATVNDDPTTDSGRSSTGGTHSSIEVQHPPTGFPLQPTGKMSLVTCGFVAPRQQAQAGDPGNKEALVTDCGDRRLPLIPISLRYCCLRDACGTLLVSETCSARIRQSPTRTLDHLCKHSRSTVTSLTRETPTVEAAYAV